MGKAKPVNLPNGASWPKAGDATAHFQAMLARYQDNTRVTDLNDHSNLAALLEVYDSVLPPGQPTKIGVGISHFERQREKEHPGGSSCFFVIRIDGTSIDFSIHRAVTAAANKS